MRVSVDHDRCEGNHRCSSAAPEIFEIRDDDLAHVLIDKPAGELKDKAERAARLCPRQAVVIER